MSITKKESLPVTNRKAIISDSCLKRLSVISGIERIAITSRNEIRLIILQYLNKIMSNSVVLMEHANRKTIMDSDIKESMKMLKLLSQTRVNMVVPRRVSMHQNQTKHNLIPYYS